MAASPLRPTTPTLAKYPIPVELITALYRARGADLDTLVAGMTEYARARVAAYCVERERLLDLGLHMAATCGEATLMKAAGAKAGAALFAQSRPAPAPDLEAASEPAHVPPTVDEPTVAEPVLIESTPAEPIMAEPVLAEPTPVEPSAPALRILEFPAVAPAAEAAPALVGPVRTKAA
ncbi:hypothetical protein PMNALOAF_1054 [Methylobacterium adhaesivum]|uniref:Uncharacterized protein n=1 Tax=Methylobacterium adhaesivum TaxID=333297 RepID=A0ABT8BHU7_9HYPH|nr:hypothetical protein [Methylobacterium adhaesivum]MDN3590798.1 hypothetical protein [Methylobacterium adhaesivum]GJD29814.1 hypothetical protein PMNALOAF_1054 [Methylobacterium adhaesivum]